MEPFQRSKVKVDSLQNYFGDCVYTKKKNPSNVYVDIGINKYYKI